MEYRGVVFDWDGTLLDSIPRAYEAVCRICDECNVPRPNREYYNARFRAPYIPFFRGLGVTFSESEIWKLYGSYADHVNAHFFSDAKATLKRLAEMGIPVGIASGQRDEVIRARVAEISNGSIPEFIAADLGDKAPALLRFCTLHKCRPKEVLMIGDFVADVVDAKSIGMTSVGLTRGVVSASIFWEAGADYVIDHLDGLTPILIG